MDGYLPEFPAFCDPSFESYRLYRWVDTYQNFRHSVAQYIANENDGRDDHVGWADEVW
jgi:hypothetical protein